MTGPVGADPSGQPHSELKCCHGEVGQLSARFEYGLRRQPRGGRDQPQLRRANHFATSASTTGARRCH